MAQVNIEVKAQVEDAIRGLGQIKTSFNDFDTANRDAAGALGTFGISLSSLNSPITAVAGGVKASIDETMQWGETVDKLTRSTGLSAQEASHMAVVLGDFGIQADSLDKVVKQFTKNGLEFNLDTIKKLATEYQNIKDPVQRDQFAFDNFGRSGLEMNEILSKTPAELQAVSDAALYSGKVMNEQGVESVQQFGVKVKQLNDQLDGLKIAVGGPLVDTLSRAIDGFKNLTGLSNVLGISILQKTGIISDDEAAARANAAAHGDLFAVYHNVDVAAYNLSQTTEHLKDDEVQSIPVHYENASAIQQWGQHTATLTDGQIKAGQAIMDATKAAADQAAQLAVSAGMSGTVTKAIDDYKSAMADATAKAAENKDGLNDLVIKEGEAKDQLDKTTGAFILQNLAMNAAPEAQLEIGHALGLIDDKSYDLALRVQELTRSWDLNKNGMIDAGSEANGLAGALHNQQLGVEAAAGALPPMTDSVNTAKDAFSRGAEAIDTYNAKLAAIPKDTVITITTKFIEEHYGAGGPGYTGGSGTSDGTGGNGGYNNPAAQLRSVIANQSQTQGNP